MNNIKESNDMNELMLAINKLKKEFLRVYMAAPMRREYVFGQNVPSKSDVQRDFIMNLKALVGVWSLKIPNADGKKDTALTDLLATLDNMDTGSSNDIQNDLDNS